jgi:hypothetical protein
MTNWMTNLMIMANSGIVIKPTVPPTPVAF